MHHWIDKVRGDGCTQVAGQPRRCAPRRAIDRSIVTRSRTAPAARSPLLFAAVKSLPAEQLKIYREPAAEVFRRSLDAETLGRIERLCASLSAALGQPLTFTPADNGEAASDQAERGWVVPLVTQAGGTFGTLTFETLRAGNSAAGRKDVPEFLERLAELITAQLEVYDTLRQREAERAALAVPEPARGRIEDVDRRLRAVLGGAADSLKCHACAAYVLDEETTELNLVAAVGLPDARLLEPPRPLEGALGDLEALTGHAVVLEDDALHGLWRVPEPCGAALCVPVATDTSILGTLWLYAREPRSFTMTECNLAEIIAGRVALELAYHRLILAGRSRQ
ncbi:MAG: GAF domain-containing protein [Planctomycetota bacterium]|nr:MAG: GAF domain-containing protein [Planctomycetota bacterium]